MSSDAVAYDSYGSEATVAATAVPEIATEKVIFIVGFFDEDDEPLQRGIILDLLAVYCHHSANEEYDINKVLAHARQAQEAGASGARVVIYMDCERFDVIDIYYCGHANADGMLVFQDGLFDTYEIADTIVGLPQRSVTVSLHLNCCYADRVLACIVGEDEAMHLLKDSGLPEETIAKLQKAGASRETDEATIWALVDTDRVPQVDGVYYHCYSLGNISHIGAMSYRLAGYRDEIVDVTVDMSLVSLRGKRVPNYVYDRCIHKMTMSNVRTKPFQTDCVVMYAAPNGGDCTLVHVGDINIMVDGARWCRNNNTDMPPVFWDDVKQLEKLDAVFLTHGDTDHSGGLLVLAEWMCATPTSFFIDRFVFTGVENGVTSSRDPPWWAPKKLQHLAECSIASRKGVKDLVVNLCTGDELRINGDIVVVVLLPTDEDRKRVSRHMEQAILVSGNRSDINCMGLVFVIEIKRGDTVQRLLFTGDANGSEIIRELEKYVKSKGVSEFFYVHVPHHGAEIGAPLINWPCNNKIIVHNFGVSTNGRYKHPHADVVSALLQYFERFSSSGVLFPSETTKLLATATFKRLQEQARSRITYGKVEFPALPPLAGAQTPVDDDIDDADLDRDDKFSENK